MRRTRATRSRWSTGIQARACKPPAREALWYAHICTRRWANLFAREESAVIPSVAVQVWRGGRYGGRGGSVGCRPVRGRAAGKKGALLLGRLVDERTSVLRRLSYRRGDEVGFGRFLGNEK